MNKFLLSLLCVASVGCLQVIESQDETPVGCATDSDCPSGTTCNASTERCECEDFHFSVQSGCTSCARGFKGDECRTCVDSTFTGDRCDQCANPKFAGDRCLECADARFMGVNCDQCSARFTGANCDQCAAVSYTHLTLPTICSV